MKKKFIFTIFFMLGICSICFAQDGEGVQFRIIIENIREISNIALAIRTEEDVETFRRNLKCDEHKDMVTQTIIAKCPEGVEYKEYKPEIFSIDPKTIVNSSFTVQSKRIKVNDRYNIQVSARRLSQSQSIEALSAYLTGTANSSTMELAVFDWVSRPTGY
jgi:hypothetical protein